MQEIWHKSRRWVLSVLLLMTASMAIAGESERLFRQYDSTDGLADNGAQVIVCTKTGRMVISSIGHINFYNGSSFNHIDPLTRDAMELPKYLGHYHLYFDKQHHLWVKDKYQVTCVNLMTEQFIHDVKGELAKMGFKGKAEDLFVDHDGCVLILSGNKLYNCKTKQSLPVRNGKNLLDVASVDGKMMLLFYDDTSVEAYDHDKGIVVYIKTALDAQTAKRYNRSSVLCESPMGFYRILNGETESMLMHIDAMSGQTNVIMQQPYHLNNMTMRDSILYIAAEKGYWTFNVKTGEQQHYPTLTRNDYQTIETDINDIAFDLQGGMWVGTEKRGLLYAKPYESPFIIYPWSHPKARQYGDMLSKYAQAHKDTMPRRTNCSFRDSRGWRWLGAYTGLKVFQTKNAEPIAYSVDHGLNNNVIHSIVEDNNHNIWVGTSSGICVLQIEGNKLHKIVSFSEEDNIPKGTFVNGYAMKLADGRIIMQSLDYVVEFDPKKFHTVTDNDIKLYPKLISLTVNGQNVQPGMEVDGRVILDRAITRVKEINVNYDQNTILLRFSGLNYFRPVQTFYRVRVKGFKDEWQTFSLNDENNRVNAQGMLNYPIIGIKPGRYEVEVQVSMSPDEWEVEPYVWTIVVNEPWWRMTIVYATLGLLFLGLLIANFVYYNRNTRLKLRRSNIEGGIIHRIRTFADICTNMEGEVLAPVVSELETEDDEQAEDRFADVMMRLIPVVKGQKQGELSMVKLAEVAQLDIQQFHDMMSVYLYKSPHLVTLRVRLQSVAELLRNSEKSIDEIAEELRFDSPNFMIASFYHQYRMTPEAYRTSNPR